jgi:hypothetical protein
VIRPVEVAGEATVYVQLGSFHKPVKCYVMDMLYEVDLILGEAFMLKYKSILHYGKSCIMIQKGKGHMTMNTPALPQVQPSVGKNKLDSVYFVCLTVEKNSPQESTRLLGK